MSQVDQHDTNIGYQLVRLARDQAKWSEETFGPDDVRGPLGALRHLKKEAQEAADAVDDKVALVKELSDILILFLDARRRAGFSLLEIIQAAQAKMVENKARQWPDWRTADGTQPIEHLKE